MNLAIIQRLYPMAPTTKAVSGLIPIDFFNEHEYMIRLAMKKHNLRLYYRGKREPVTKNGLKPTCTLRRNATAVVLYPQSKSNTIMKTDKIIDGVAALILLLTAIAIGYVTFNSEMTTRFLACASKSNAEYVLDECTKHFSK